MASRRLRGRGENTCSTILLVVRTARDTAEKLDKTKQDGMHSSRRGSANRVDMCCVEDEDYLFKRYHDATRPLIRGRDCHARWAKETKKR